MRLVYHKNSLDLLGIESKLSKYSVDLIDDFESRYNLIVPAALREWYSLDNNYVLLQQIATPHNVVEIKDMPQIQADYCNLFSPSEPFSVLIENQSVWHVGVKFNEGENPPVYFRYNEPGESWVLHASSFSDWIHALSWDHFVISKSLGNVISATPETQNSLLGFQVAAPETYVGNVYFKGSKFVRMEKEDRRLLVIYHDV